MTNPDFTHTTTLSASPSVRKPINVAQPLLDAAAIAYQIRSHNPDPKTWKAGIEAAPVELRVKVREILAAEYERMRERARVARDGKRTSAGDAAIAELAKRL